MYLCVCCETVCLFVCYLSISACSLSDAVVLPVPLDEAVEENFWGTEDEGMQG
jgi:hypothetical protein